MRTAKKWWNNRGLLYLAPFIACLVDLVRLADGRQTEWDLDFAAFACLFMALKMLQQVLDLTDYARPLPARQQLADFES